MVIVVVIVQDTYEKRREGVETVFNQCALCKTWICPTKVKPIEMR